MSEILSKLRARLVMIADKHAILLEAEASPIWVSFAFVERESEELILPESLLDDWGREIKSFAVYQWIKENGQQFPRAEIFGYRSNGDRVQRFLREIDLTAAYRCFAKRRSEESLASMSLVELVLIQDETNGPIGRISPPHNLPYPLPQINADWWKVSGNDIAVFEKAISGSLGPK